MTEIFSQEDHERLFGKDEVDRLHVEADDMAAELRQSATLMPVDMARLYRFLASEIELRLGTPVPPTPEQESDLFELHQPEREAYTAGETRIIE